MGELGNLEHELWALRGSGFGRPSHGHGR